MYGGGVRAGGQVAVQLAAQEASLGLHSIAITLVIQAPGMAASTPSVPANAPPGITQSTAGHTPSPKPNIPSSTAGHINLLIPGLGIVLACGWTRHV